MSLNANSQKKRKPNMIILFNNFLEYRHILCCFVIEASINENQKRNLKFNTNKMTKM